MLKILHRTVTALIALLIIVINCFKSIPGLINKPDLPSEGSTAEITTEEITTVPSTETTVIPTTAPVIPDSTTSTTVKPTETTKNQTIIVTGTNKTVPETGTLVRTVVSKGSEAFGGNGVDVFKGSDANNRFAYACGITTSSDGDMQGNVGVSANANGSFLVKYDSSFNRLWQKVFSENDGTVNFEDVAVLKDNNIVVVGYSSSAKYTYSPETKETIDAFVIKLSPDGDIIWKKSFGGSGIEMLNCVCASGDGFAVGGSTTSVDGYFEGLPEYGSSSAILMNFDSDGNALWKRYLNGKKGASIDGIDCDDGGNIFAACQTGSIDGDFASFSGLFGGYIDSLILKYDSTGKILWHFPIASNGRDNFACVVADGEGGCLVGGYYERIGTAPVGGTFTDIHHCGGIDSVVFRINPDGTQRWYKIISGLENDYIYDIAKVEGGYIAVGATSSSNREFSGNKNFGANDGFADFFTPGGATVEVITQGGSREDCATTVAVCNNNAFVFGKTTSSDNYFAGYNSNLSDGLIEILGDLFTGYVSKYAIRAY